MADHGPCLHCAINEAIYAWLEQHTERENGRMVIDVPVVLSKLAEVTAEFVEMPSDRSKRRRGLRFAHEALDAGVKHLRTGQAQFVDIPAEH